MLADVGRKKRKERLMVGGDLSKTGGRGRVYLEIKQAGGVFLKMTGQKNLRAELSRRISSFFEFAERANEFFSMRGEWSKVTELRIVRVVGQSLDFAERKPCWRYRSSTKDMIKSMYD